MITVLCILCGLLVIAVVGLAQNCSQERWRADFNGRRAEFWKSQSDAYRDMVYDVADGAWKRNEAGRMTWSEQCPLSDEPRVVGSLRIPDDLQISYTHVDKLEPIK